MMDITLIQSTISGLKLAGDIAKSFLELKSISEIQGKVIELQSAILSAQNSALAANAAQATLIEGILFKLPGRLSKKMGKRKRGSFLRRQIKRRML